MSFGQIVLGPPGSGKTTYCNGMKQFLTALGRKVAIINLDPANEFLPHEPSVDIRTLVTLQDVIDEFHLGPNGGLVYCMEYLEKNVDWLEKQLESIQDHYFLFDFPGQVELYSHHSSVRNIVAHLSKKASHRLTCIYLVDSYYCHSPFTYLSALILALSTMLHIELPHVNVFSKIDLVEKNGLLDFNLEFYADAVNLSHLVNTLDNATHRNDKIKRLTQALSEVIEDFSLVSFTTLNIQSKESMAELVHIIDKTNGYMYLDQSAHDMLEIINVSDVDFEYNRIQAIQEKYMQIRELEFGGLADRDEEENGIDQ